MSIVWTIIIGIVAGFIAAKIIRGSGMGLFVDLVIGVIGAVIGNLVLNSIGLETVTLVGELFAATVGAIILLLIVGVIQKKYNEAHTHSHHPAA